MATEKISQSEAVSNAALVQMLAEAITAASEKTKQDTLDTVVEALRETVHNPSREIAEQQAAIVRAQRVDTEGNERPAMIPDVVLLRGNPINEQFMLAREIEAINRVWSLGVHGQLGADRKLHVVRRDDGDDNRSLEIRHPSSRDESIGYYAKYPTFLALCDGIETLWKESLAERRAALKRQLGEE